MHFNELVQNAILHLIEFYFVLLRLYERGCVKQIVNKIVQKVFPKNETVFDYIRNKSMNFIALCTKTVIQTAFNIFILLCDAQSCLFMWGSAQPLLG